MSEGNIALARKVIDALNRRDFDAWLAFVSPNVVWEALEGLVGMSDVYHGRAEVREWIERMSQDTEAGIQIAVEEMTDLGDGRVFIGLVLTAHRRGSGVPIEWRTWQIVSFTDGLITRRQVFWTRAEALRATALTE